MTTRKRNGRFFTSLALMGSLAGVLIWAKLRLSTDMPRAAYADPEDSQVDEVVETSELPESPEQAEAPIVGASGSDEAIDEDG